MHAPVQARLSRVLPTIPVERGQVPADEFLWRFLSDPTFAAEVAYCCTHGLPHSEFLGRVVYPGEARWLPRDRAVALAYQQYMAERCGDCGTHPDQWPEGMRGYPMDPEWERCQACRAIGAAESDQPDEGTPRGVRVKWRRVGGQPLVPRWVE